MTSKSIRLRMTDKETGAVCFWTIRHVPRAFNCDGGTYQNPRIILGWEYIDHEGYTRMIEGTWRELLPAFRLSAENYGFDCNIS